MSLNPFLHLKNGAVVKLQEIKSLTDHLLSTYFMVGLPFWCETQTDGKLQHR